MFNGVTELSFTVSSRLKLPIYLMIKQQPDRDSSLSNTYLDILPPYVLDEDNSRAGYH